jgi:hypothetical protein
VTAVTRFLALGYIPWPLQGREPSACAAFQHACVQYDNMWDTAGSGQADVVPSIHFGFLLHFQLGHRFSECVYNPWLFFFLFLNWS